MPKILMIEDSEADADLYMEYLDLSIYDIKWVKNLAAGVSGIQVFAPDVILLDLTLPDSRGVENTFSTVNKAQRLLGSGNVWNIPIIVMTGRNEEKLVKSLMENGAQDYLVKDRVTSELLQRSVQYSIWRVAHEKQQAVRFAEMRATQEEIAQDLYNAWNDTGILFGRLYNLIKPADDTLYEGAKK